MDTSTENILRLADVHIFRYTNYLHDAKMTDGKGYRMDELRNLKAIWEAIKWKKGVWDDLNKEEQREVIDAITSGE